MNTIGNNSLLALMLALKDLQSPLSDDEKSGLSDVAAQLSLDPDAWESDIEPTLMGILEANSNLHQLFEAAKSQLEAVGDIPKDLLPTQNDLAKVIPSMAKPEERGFEVESDESDFHSNEINNMVISILSHPNPSEATKKIGRFDKIKQFLKQPTGVK